MATEQTRRGPGRPKIHESPQAGQAAYRAKRGKSVFIYLPPELVAELDEHIQHKQLRDRSEVLTAALKRHLREAKRER